MMMVLPAVGRFFLLAIVSGTSMGICLKFLSSYSPYVSNGIAGLTFGVVCLVLWFFWGDKQAGFTIHPAMIALGLSLASLNIAYSLLYGAQVPTAYVPIIVTGVMTVALGIVGWQVFGETITWNFIIGTVFILVGMGIMVR